MVLEDKVVSGADTFKIYSLNHSENYTLEKHIQHFIAANEQFL